MALDVPTASNSRVSAGTAPLKSQAETSLDERWAAWRSRAAEHDRVFRRKVTIAVPLLAIVAAVVLAFLVR